MLTTSVIEGTNVVRVTLQGPVGDGLAPHPPSALNHRQRATVVLYV